jgi:hypothetical protein
MHTLVHSRNWPKDLVPLFTPRTFEHKHKFNPHNYPRVYSPSTPSANGSNVPPCPNLGRSEGLLALPGLDLPLFFFCFSLSANTFWYSSWSTSRRDLANRGLSRSKIDIDVGPDGFTIANRPSSGSELVDTLGILV